MSQLRLIEANPATEAYQRGTQFAQQQKANDLQIEGRMLSNAENMAAAPHRLRTVEASADVAGVNAQYAAPRAAAGLRSAEAGATTAEVNARYAEPNAAAGLRQKNAAALNAEMQGFYKSLDLLNAGDPASAAEVARMTGQALPPEVVQDAELRQAVTQIAARAQQLYPNRPADQQQFIQGQMHGLKERAEKGEQIFTPTTPYEMPQDAPQPPEISSASGGRASVFQQKQAAWLAVHPNDHQGALSYASGRTVLTDTQRMNMASQIMAREFQGQFMIDPARKQQRVQQIYQELMGLEGGGAGTMAPPPTGTPAAPAAPAAPGQQGQAAPPMQGAGTREQPFQATTQDQIEWFKQSAPAGSVLSVEGKLYAK